PLLFCCVAVPPTSTTRAWGAEVSLRALPPVYKEAAYSVQPRVLMDSPSARPVKSTVERVSVGVKVRTAAGAVVAVRQTAAKVARAMRQKLRTENRGRVHVFIKGKGRRRSGDAGPFWVEFWIE